MATPGKSSAEHVENLALEDAVLEDAVLEWAGIDDDARRAIGDEHRLTVMKAIKKYPKACLWSMVISLTIIMDGYDGALLGSLSAFPSFRNRFGVHLDAANGYQIQAHWQLALGCSSSIGNIVGIYLGAITTDRFGYKRSLIGWLLLLTGCIFISFFAPHISVIFAGELLCGTSWGVFATTAPAYASEVSPTVLRGILEVWIVICWGIGQLLSYSVLLTLNTNLTMWGWKIPFAVQWVWPVIIVPLISFAPESPWWLLRKGKRADAGKTLQRLSSGLDDEAVQRAVALMMKTDHFEESMNESAGYRDCFRGTNLWRTEIACVAWSAQLWCGFVISAYATYFYELAGLKPADAYKMSVGQGGLHILFNLISVPVVNNVGRRRMYLVGLSMMGTLMFLIGFIALAPQTKAVGYASSTLFLLWNCAYELTVGPAAYIVVSEISTTRLRAKTIGLARNAYNLSIIINYFVGPYVLNPGEGNWKGKTGFLTGGLIILLLIWTWFRLPETKDRTFVEIDMLFSKPGIKARQFKNYKIEEIQTGDEKIDHAE